MKIIQKDKLYILRMYFPVDEQGRTADYFVCELEDGTDKKARILPGGHLVWQTDEEHDALIRAAMIQPKNLWDLFYCTFIKPFIRLFTKK